MPADLTTEQMFYRVPLLRVNQKGKYFWLGKMTGEQLESTFTVEPAEYDLQKHQFQAKQFTSDRDYYEFLIGEDKQRLEDRPFQRKENRARILEIATYLATEENALFPNAVIVTCDLFNSFEESAGTEETLQNRAILEQAYIASQSIICQDGEQEVLLIPRKSGSILVIDGQHRLGGLHELLSQSKEEFKDFEVIISFVIGFSRSSVAELFYTINYTQKSVNKSLLYQLMGEFSQDINETTFLHETVKLLNELERSPLHGRIKMLGVVPPNSTPEQRAKMTVSQAFLIEYLSRSLSPKASRSNYLPVFLPQFSKHPNRIEIVRFLLKYLTAVSKIDEAGWNNPEASVLSKTISVGAFLRAMFLLLAKLYVDTLELNPDRLSEVTVEQISGFLAGVETIDFSAGGPHGGINSAGSLIKLEREILAKAAFAQDGTAGFLADFKERIKPRFLTYLESEQLTTA